MPLPKTAAVIPPANRLAGVSYSIRRVAVEGKKVEATGKRIHWLNTGDPIAFGFKTPAHMVEAVQASLGAGENTSRGWPISADRIVITAGSSEGIDFALTALTAPGDELLLPRPTYPL